MQDLLASICGCWSGSLILQFSALDTGFKLLDMNSTKRVLKHPSHESHGTKMAPKASNVAHETGGHPSPPDTSASLFSMRAFEAERDLPIVYASEYNMSMIGIEMLHQFDTNKYSKLANMLSDDFLDTPFARFRHRNEPKDEDDEASHYKQRRLRYLAPNRPVNKSELMIHHTADYVERIHEEKSLVARITETWALNLMPQSFIETRLLTPIKWQVAGTIYATHLAMQHGWAVNLGGGFHVASANDGDTFCLFSDIALTMKYIWRKHPLQKFMIIDLDAHQATGLERDLIEMHIRRRKMVYMVDVFNGSVQPPDPRADKGADQRVELHRFTGDETYLNRVNEALRAAFEQFKPTLVIYVAGQDVLIEDQLGLLNVTDVGLMKRDEMVFSMVTEKFRCPIVMLLGGGYLPRGTKVLADSIRNLYEKGLIWGGHRSGTRSLSRPRVQKPNQASVSKTLPHSHMSSTRIIAASPTQASNKAPGVCGPGGIKQAEYKFQTKKLSANAEQANKKL